MEENTAPRDCEVYCPVCRKVLSLQAGDPIPRCCGKPMRILN